MTATFTVNEGDITVAAGNTGVSIVSNNASSVSFTGTLAQINALLTGTGTGTVVYNNNSNTPSASTPITLTVNDGGNTGADPGLTADGSSEEGSASQTINIAAINDNPGATGLVTDISVSEDVLSNVDLSAVNFTDPDAATGALSVTLSTSSGGELTLAADANLVFGGVATARTITGSLADLNSYFNTASNIQYLHSSAHTNGNDADTISVVINDNGNTGAGGGTDQNIGTVNVDITAVNDNPVNTVPGTQTVAEETAAVISGISISDVDATSNNLTTRLQVSNGTVNVSLAGAASLSAGVNGTADLTIQGTLADINATLASLSYTGNADVVGINADTLTVTTDDLGNSGSGGAQSDIDSIQIDITGINDTPEVAGPGTAYSCLLYTSPSPRDATLSRMPSSA